MKIEILNVKIDQINLTECLNKISEFLTSSKQNYIVTVNPEFVVEAQQNQEFKNVLNNADLATCDGIGLVWASGGKLKRVTGVDLTEALLKQIDCRIFLLGGEGGSAQKLAQNHSLKIVGAERGGKIDQSTWLLDDNNEIIEKINQSGANVLLVGFGQVKQEMWLSQNLAKMPNIKAAIGVGGTFDYLSGNIKRAPRPIRQAGLEWLFRLFTQPHRLGRIFNATFMFFWLFLFKKYR